ncbi:IPExxxVDY family protein [Dokdonia sinensis]|uniref:IPExxxVDY family protein n=1 Tax=Dokdonia sinensis TaxID=2479847 RepID=A0A3M0GQ08_9FLAO|nr:IPExxxVDY family protein [Dokdonia sinensis]RMB63259.1 IPExxxVDY family protein [Dokdonia sinensis]
MGTYKLVLENDISYDFTLIAIHCSLEPYYLAFLLNKHLKIKLERRRKDVLLNFAGLEAGFPLFQYEDDYRYLTYQLLQNRVRISVAREEKDGLFGFENNGTKRYVFMQELPKVDFMLRIVDDGSAFAKAKTITTLNQITQIVTAYNVEVTTLKAKENLIIE